MIERVFSGAQPSGCLHLGNYLGAVRHWVRLQDCYSSVIFCVVDLHAVTVPYDPKSLLYNARQALAMYISCGLDPKKCIIFKQSDMPDHSYLSWLLSCFTSTGALNRMTQYKSKSNKGNTSFGLYAYPVLMAADVLLYNANLVPVGDDQRQHIELCRDIANSFNSWCGFDFFTLPEAMIYESGSRIMSLRDASVKMSKSDVSEGSRINLNDPPDVIARKISKAKTDDIMGFEDLESRPEARNLIEIYTAITGNVSIPAEVSNFAQLKSLLTEVVVDMLKPITSRFNEIKDDTKFLDKVFEEGCIECHKISRLGEIKKVMGLS